MIKKYYIILTVLLVSAGIIFYGIQNKGKYNSPDFNDSSRQKYTDITAEKLKEMLKNKDFYLVNVHIPYEGEIENTDAFIPFDQIEKNLNKFPEDKNTKIVLYCQSGRMSVLASKSLSPLGYSKVFNLLLGMHDWQSKGFPLKLPKSS